MMCSVTASSLVDIFLGGHEAFGALVVTSQEVPDTSGLSVFHRKISSALPWTRYGNSVLRLGP